MRNPWSSERYTGAWSDSSSLWTDAARKEVGLVKANDGAFFLPFDTYVTYFWGASVSIWHTYAGYQQINTKQTAWAVDYTVTNPTAQELYVVAETYSDRNYPRTCKPGNNYVLYLYNASGTRVGSYGFIGWAGWGFVGTPGAALPAGTYTVKLVNQASSSGKVADISLNFYWQTKKGTAKAK